MEMQTSPIMDWVEKYIGGVCLVFALIVIGIPLAFGWAIYARVRYFYARLRYGNKRQALRFMVEVFPWYIRAKELAMIRRRKEGGYAWVEVGFQSSVAGGGPLGGLSFSGPSFGWRKVDSTTTEKQKLASPPLDPFIILWVEEVERLKRRNKGKTTED